MALPSSGPLTLNQIHIEAGGGSGTAASLNDADIRGLIGKSSGAQNSFSEYYGASAEFTFAMISGTFSPASQYKAGGGAGSVTGNPFDGGFTLASVYRSYSYNTSFVYVQIVEYTSGPALTSSYYSLFTFADGSTKIPSTAGFSRIPSSPPYATWSFNFGTVAAAAAAMPASGSWEFKITP